MSPKSAAPHLESLRKAAATARDNAYAPYSGHKVGASIRTSDGQVYGGCNVENSSYGGTVCAERVAIQKAVSENGRIQITDVLVITDAVPPWPPCGFCRQVIAEFATPQTRIYSTNLKGELRETTFSALFPEAFTPNHLIRNS